MSRRLKRTIYASRLYCGGPDAEFLASGLLVLVLSSFFSPLEPNKRPQKPFFFGDWSTPAWVPVSPMAGCRTAPFSLDTTDGGAGPGFRPKSLGKSCLGRPQAVRRSGSAVCHQ